MMTTILVIEDDDLNRQYIHRILTNENYTVEMANDGQLGLEMLERYTPDLILCDVMMPHVDGFTVLHEIRQTKHTASIPFILLTALDGREDMRTGMELGADDYLTKPFTPEDLVMAVQTQLRKRTLRQDELDTTMRLLRRNITYSLPHEIRTPLLKIMGFSDLMRVDPSDLSLNDIAGWSETIFNAGKRLNRMLENYLVYAQIELIASDPDERAALRNHITKAPHHIIHEVSLEVAERWRRDADLHLDLADHGLQIAKDDLRKIFLEFVDNAFKFSEPGTTVVVKSFISDEDYHFIVIDAGRGMEAGQIALIGAYMQFERTLYEQQGLGLGMVIAKRLVELHDGKVTIKSRPGEGTYIMIKFPLY